MNIIYMHTHDSGRYFQPYGYAVPTPNLMHFAQSATLFRHAYCAGPTCSASRAALLIGMCAHESGMIGLAHRGFKLKDYSQHLARYLSEQGYETALSGVQHETSWDRSQEDLGYQKLIVGKGDLYAENMDAKNAEAVCAYLAEPKDKPFFLSYGLFHTHRPFPTELTANPDYVIPPAPLYDNANNREDFAAYITSAKIADECIGKVLQALEDTGHDKDTLVIFTTDHGIAFPFMKCNLYDSGIGVALMMRYPGNPLAGKAIDTLTSHVDVFPTICDLIATPKPVWLQGESLLPVFRGEREEVHEEVFSEVTFHAAYEPMRCVRTKRYKLIRLYEPSTQFIPANVDDSASKTFVYESWIADHERAEELLFDLYLDPNERNNLVAAPAYAGVYAEMTKRLDDWMARTHDPLIPDGFVAKPEGAKVNKVTEYSPSSNDFE
ncbi:MAG: sulfatase [Clostridia bacterium]